MVVLKITCGNEVRRFSNVRPNCLNYQQFIVDLQKIFPQLGASFQVRYIDDENEEVVIGNDMELQDAISLAENQSRTCLRLTVERIRSVHALDFGYPAFMGGGDSSLVLNMPQGMLNYSSRRPDVGADGGPAIRDDSFVESWDPLQHLGDTEGNEIVFPGITVPVIAQNGQVQNPNSVDPYPTTTQNTAMPPTKQARVASGAVNIGVTDVVNPTDSPAATSITFPPAAGRSKSKNARTKSGSAGTSSSNGNATANAGGAPSKLLRRRARNRVSARKSRMRKKLYHDSLQVANDVLTAENKALKERIKELEAAAGKASISSMMGVGTSELGPSKDSDGKVVSNTELATSDLQLLSQVDFLNKSFCICDPNKVDNPIIYCSDSFVKLTGYPRSEILGRNCRFLQGPKTDARAVQAIREAIEQGCDAEVKILNYRKDGSVFWNQFFIAALRDEEGKIVHFVGVQQELKFPKNMPQPEQSAKSIFPSDYKEPNGKQQELLQRRSDVTQPKEEDACTTKIEKSALPVSPASTATAPVAATAK